LKVETFKNINPTNKVLPDLDVEVSHVREEEEDELLGQVEASLSSLPINISHVRCGVHTLQLAIVDGLKTPHAAALIGKLRSLAVELRTPKISEKLRREGLRMAVIDVETRWGSTYLMIDRVVELRAFISESVDIYQKNLQLSTAQWKQAQELRDMLKKSFEVTKKMQLDDLTPGYFFRKWTGLRLLMEAHGSTIATGKTKLK
jgi:hypothetical protein